jgi:hypothetical protein
MSARATFVSAFLSFLPQKGHFLLNQQVLNFSGSTECQMGKLPILYHTEKN